MQSFSLPPSDYRMFERGAQSRLQDLRPVFYYLDIHYRIIREYTKMRARHGRRRRGRYGVEGAREKLKSLVRGPDPHVQYYARSLPRLALNYQRPSDKI